MLTVNQAQLAKILDGLKKTSAKIAKRAVSKAARKAMKPVRDQVKEDAPHDTGKLEANVTLRTSAKKDGTVTARVGIKGGAKKNPETPFYFRFQEFGTEEIPAKPFMRPALEENAQSVLDTVAEELNKALDE